MEGRRLDSYLKDRQEQLKKAKRDGVKIIGYFPSNYVPEEIIYASGGLPLCLAHGGNLLPADTALSLLPRVICPFARTQLGEMLLKKNPYYNMIDMLVAPITCVHLRKVAEVLEYYGGLEIFKLGVPHKYDGDFELEYFTDRLRALKDRLQVLTGTEITNERISEGINLYNRIRNVLKRLALMRSNVNSPISALDFIKLNHASFYIAPSFMIEILESVYHELIEKQQNINVNAPRLLLVGPNIGYGDYKMLKLVEEAGGNIVTEEVCEGIRYYWQEVENKGDLFQSLANAYLRDRVPCAFMRYSAKRRLDFALELIDDFNVSGIIWYELSNCETYDSESYFFARKMEENNIPMLILESNYGMEDFGQLKTRIEAFIEIIKGVV